MTIATSILVMVALTVGGTLAIAVIYAIIVRGRNWWRELFSVRVLPFLLIGLAVGATTFGIGLAAKSSADEALRLAVEDIEADCNDQLNLLLHANAYEFVDRYSATNGLSHGEILELSEYCALNEVTLVGADGRIIDTTDPGTKTGAMFFTDDDKHAPYRALLDGRKAIVSQRFRVSATCENRVVKYFGIALPRGGFIQIGYLWEMFEREFGRFFLPIFETRIVGNSGFCIVLDDKNIVDVAVPGHPESKGMTAADVGFTRANLAVPLGRVFRAWIFGVRCRCMAYPESVAGRRIYAVVPLSERQWPALLLAIGVAFVLFASYLIFRLVLRKFRQQQEKINALRAKEEERRAMDLALARAIQCAELRTDGVDGDGYHITSLMNAAREVGGDFYDYYELPNGRLVVTIADVSGKGVPAAFFMMKARMTLKSCVYSSATLAEAVAKANDRLSVNNPAEMFVTAWVGVYDRKTGNLDYVSAGHNPPLVRRLSPGAVEWLQAPRCAALGVFEGVRYRGAQAMLSAGDRLFLYTDGVTEAMNKAGELFGNERLEAVLNGVPAPLVPIVKKCVDTFVDGAEQSDDITMLELEIKS